MSRRPRLTDDDWNTIRIALNHAMDERDSFADAYSYTGPEAEAAMAKVKRFEKLHEKMFGGPSARTQEHAEFAAQPTISIMKLIAGKPK